MKTPGRAFLPESHRAMGSRNWLVCAGEHRARRRWGSLPQAAQRARRAKRARQIEIWGRGIQRIFAACKEAGAPKPSLTFDGTGLALEFRYAPEYLKAMAVVEQVTAPVTPEVTPEVSKMLAVMTTEMSRVEIMAHLGLRDEKHFREHYQQASISTGLIERTIPDKPNSRLQKYRLTAKGRAWLEQNSRA